MTLRLLLILLVSLSSVNAQEETPLFRNYTSLEYQDSLERMFPEIREVYRQIAEVVPDYVDEDEWEEITIPIVFHVLYTSSADRVSQEQIIRQLEMLNADFSELNIPEEDERDPDGFFREKAANPRIRFCRPLLGLNNLPTLGIDSRLVSSEALLNPQSLKAPDIGLPAWSATNYLNVWIAPIAEDNSGFAQLPGGPGEFDGIVVNSRFFGDEAGTAIGPFTGGKTLTHLIGRYLGLSPIWGNEPCSDDGINDTPLHNAPNYGNPGKDHYAACSGYPLEMTMNFMDNTDDDYLYMFTREQANRMRAVITASNLRGGLLDVLTLCNPIDPIWGRSVENSDESKTSTALTAKPGEVSVFPNPAATRFTVRFAAPRGSLTEECTLYDMSGRVVDKKVLNGESNGSFEFYPHQMNLAKGVYFVKVLFSNDTTIVKKVSLQ